MLIKLDGYKPFETKLTKKFNAWYLGNILFGGLVGLVVDPITGAIYSLSPNEIKAELGESTAFKNNGNNIYIAVSLKKDPSWNQIGQLEKL